MFVVVLQLVQPPSSCSTRTEGRIDRHHREPGDAEGGGGGRVASIRATRALTRSSSSSSAAARVDAARDGALDAPQR